MTKYQKKPVTVEAFQWNNDKKSDYPDWLSKAFHDGVVWVTDGEENICEPVLIISTLEGFMNAEIGDFVIQGVHGEIYSCKPDIFEETYIKVNDTDHTSPDDIGNDIQESLHGGDK